MAAPSAVPVEKLDRTLACVGCVNLYNDWWACALMFKMAYGEEHGAETTVRVLLEGKILALDNMLVMLMGRGHLPHAEESMERQCKHCLH